MENKTANITITIDGVEHTVHAPGVNGKRAHKVIRDAVIELGFDWVESDVFIANFPERGRALKKSAGIQTLGAIG
tara:strand:- start:197 stop:421 length:225 start_codon:yes stop_codon:yes gene_type:complete